MVGGTSTLKFENRLTVVAVSLIMKLAEVAAAVQEAFPTAAVEAVPRFSLVFIGHRLVATLRLFPTSMSSRRKVIFQSPLRISEIGSLPFEIKWGKVLLTFQPPNQFTNWSLIHEGASIVQTYSRAFFRRRFPLHQPLNGCVFVFFLESETLLRKRWFSLLVAFANQKEGSNSKKTPK